MGTGSAGASRRDAMAVRPRAAASQILGRVIRGGAYANVLIDAWTKDLPASDAVLIRANVFHALRWLGRIDRTLAQHVSRPLQRLEHPVLDLLRVGAAEIMLGTHPAHVVSDLVEVAREVGKPKAAGLVNAVLRKVGEDPGVIGPIEIDGGFPEWLVADLSASWDRQEATAFLEASNKPPRVGVRIRPGDESPDGKAVTGIPGAWLCERPPVDSVIQDPASVAVVNALDVQEGQRVLDLTAAPGGKTQHLLDLVGPTGVVVANERHPRRARDAAKRVPQAQWMMADGRSTGLAPQSFDRVLVDGPCSGLGTLRRRPELRYRASEADIGRLAAIQSQLLVAGLELVKSDGLLVYSVCTVTVAETSTVVEPFDASGPEIGIGRQQGKGLLLAPHLCATDGMYISQVRP